VAECGEQTKTNGTKTTHCTNYTQFGLATKVPVSPVITCMLMYNNVFSIRPNCSLSSIGLHVSNSPLPAANNIYAFLYEKKSNINKIDTAFVNHFAAFRTNCVHYV